jgi:hypothetical protein
MIAWTGKMHLKNCALPLPLDPLLHSPTLALAGATVHGAVFAILVAYWRSGCCALPSDEAGLATISRCYGAQWSRVRQPVMQALAEITPHLASAHARMLRARQARQAIARLAGVASAEKRREAKLLAGSKSMLAQPRPPMLLPPQRATPFRQQRADVPTLLGVARRNAEAQRAGKVGLLRDTLSRDRN